MQIRCQAYRVEKNAKPLGIQVDTDTRIVQASQVEIEVTVLQGTSGVIKRYLRTERVIGDEMARDEMARDEMKDIDRMGRRAEGSRRIESIKDDDKNGI